MMYLREGLLCEEKLGAPGGRLWDLEDGSAEPLSEDQLEAALHLLVGLEPDSHLAVSASAAVGPERVELRDEPFDRVARKRLAELDASLRWMCPPRYLWLVELMESAHSVLKHMRPELDQLPCTPETAVRRAALLRETVGAGASVVLVGDDDLLGIAAAALGLKATVLDLDRRLLSLVERLASRLGLDVTARACDLRDPLPAELVGAFDAFCTDPEMSRECVTLFVSRGVAMVRGGGFGLCACAEEWRPLLTKATDHMGADIDRWLCRFGNYRSSVYELSPYRSDLALLHIPEDAKPLVEPTSRYDAVLFPFGLEGDDLVIRAEGWSGKLAQGALLADLAAELVGHAPGVDEAEVKDTSPLPVRVIVARRGEAQVQITVHAHGPAADILISPGPQDQAQAESLAAQVANKLGTRALKMRSLERLDPYE